MKKVFLVLSFVFLSFCALSFYQKSFASKSQIKQDSSSITLLAQIDPNSIRESIKNKANKSIDDNYNKRYAQEKRRERMYMKLAAAGVIGLIGLGSYFFKRRK